MTISHSGLLFWGHPVGGLSSSSGMHAVVIVIKKQLSLTAMSNDCMEFLHLRPHAQMPDDDTTIDYRYDLFVKISIYIYIYYENRAQGTAD